MAASGGKEINLILIGKTGHGKSYVGNALLGREAFRKSNGSASTTITAKLCCSEREEGTVVRVVDTPGFMDTRRPEESTIAEIIQGMGLCEKGFNALLFVTKYGLRYTPEEKYILDVCKKYFGPNFLADFGIVVMTEGDNFDINHEDDETTFEQWLLGRKSAKCQEPLDYLLYECNYRCVLFYNVGDDYEDKRIEGVKNLFKFVNQIPNIYTSHHFELAKKAREELVTKLDLPVLHTGIQEKISLLMDQIENDMRNNIFSYENMMKKTSALYKELEKVDRVMVEKTEFLKLQKRLDFILRRVKDIRYLDNKAERRVLQMEMYDNLEDVKNAPTKLQLFIKKAFYIFAQIVRPIGTLLTFGAAGDFFNEFVKERETLYEQYKREFDRNKP